LSLISNVECSSSEYSKRESTAIWNTADVRAGCGREATVGTFSELLGTIEPNRTLSARVVDFSTTMREESNAVSIGSVLLRELQNQCPYVPSLTNMGLCEIVHDAAKRKVIIDWYERSQDSPILCFSQEIQRLAVGDENGHSLISVAELYKVLSHSSSEVRQCFNAAIIKQLSLATGSLTGGISCKLLRIDFLTTPFKGQEDVRGSQYRHDGDAGTRKSAPLANVFERQYAIASLSLAADPSLSPLGMLFVVHEFLELIMREIANKLTWEMDMKDTPFYYSVYIERCVFFLMDPFKMGKISIQELADSRVLHDLFEVLSEQKHPRVSDGVSPNSKPSWCSVARFSKVLDQFRMCDRDGSGMISLEECHNYRDGAVTPLFLERVYATQMLYGDKPPLEMDFRGFVEMTTAITMRNQLASIIWLFRVLDLRDDGFLDRDEIKLMVLSMLENLEAFGREGDLKFDGDDITDEVMDMLHAADPNRITVEDVLISSNAVTAFGILIDLEAFFKYENRENEAAESQ
uniref:Calmodulin n=1 Tax=Heligmosomoides polygyrus TaxID=6339 RepID=A0A8L8K6A2_HELPZ